MIDVQDDIKGAVITIKIVGIGGGGNNVLRRLAASGFNKSQLLAINTDVRQLKTLDAEGIPCLLIGGAVNGLILADVDVVGVVGNIEIGAVGNVAVVLILGGGGHDEFAVLFSLGNGLLGPSAGLDVHGLAVLHQIPCHSGELQGGAALDEQNLVIVGNVHQITQIGLGLVDDLLKDLGTMAHLHDAHTAATVVHHFVADLLQNGFRHHSGAGGKVKSAIILHLIVPPVFVLLSGYTAFTAIV